VTTVALGAGLLAALGVAGVLTAILFWQLKRAAKSSDKWSSGVEKAAENQILLAAAAVAVADKERAMNMVIAERDRLEFTVETIGKQRDELLKEALDHATPGSTAIAVRNALERLRDFPSRMPEEEALPDLPGE